MTTNTQTLRQDFLKRVRNNATPVDTTDIAAMIVSNCDLYGCSEDFFLQELNGAFVDGIYGLVAIYEDKFGATRPGNEYRAILWNPESTHHTVEGLGQDRGEAMHNLYAAIAYTICQKEIDKNHTKIYAQVR